jgi:uncharacterized protein (DUF302 family)
LEDYSLEDTLVSSIAFSDRLQAANEGANKIVTRLHWKTIAQGVIVPDLPNNGIIHLSSPHSVTETLARLEAIVKAKGLPILARIDHSGDASKAGLSMRPTQLLIFGNARAGTPLMIASPTVAIDLPLKALVWQDTDDKVWLSYNSPDYLKQRHALPENLLQNIAGISSICAEAVR